MAASGRSTLSRRRFDAWASPNVPWRQARDFILTTSALLRPSCELQIRWVDRVPLPSGRPCPHWIGKPLAAGDNQVARGFILSGARPRVRSSRSWDTRTTVGAAG
jgi:hypothetical protein